MIRTIFLSMLLLVTFFSPATAQKSAGKMTAADKASMRAAVQEAAQHAWKGYKDFAGGMDDLQPLTKNGKNWYNVSMQMTAVDAFDSFVMLGLNKEAAEAKAMILSSLNFNVDNDVQVFEVTIRLLGGLITAYEMDGDPKFLQLATDLADRLLPAFNSTTGMPYRYVHLQTGATRDSINNPAEIGTLLLEFGQLAKHTGNQYYYDVAKNAIMQVYDRRSKIGLVGERINIQTGEWVSTRSHISGYIDSYYEYLHKGWLLFKDADFKKAFDLHNNAIKQNLLSPGSNGTFMRVVDMHSGKELASTYGALDAFYAGLCVLAGDQKTAADIQQANYYMWTKFGMEPEEFNFKKDSITSAYYILRPENIESAFYLYRSSKDDQYLQMGKRMVNDILKYCRTPEAFAAIKDVRTKEQFNSMQSFFFAETLKYAYLLFQDDSAVDLKQVVFNTEAHPFKIVIKKK